MLTYKFLLIGDTFVGKSCLRKRYINKRYHNNLSSTIGIDFGIKTLRFENKTVKFHIWDTSGNSVYHSTIQPYYKNTDCILLVFDISNHQTFDNLKTHMNYIKNLKYDIPIILIGNKNDLKKDVNTIDINNFVQKNKIYKYITTSAKYNININIIFKYFLDNIIKLDYTVIHKEHIHEKHTHKCCDIINIFEKFINFQI
jgi:Ras-related protein Rab-1A